MNTKIIIIIFLLSSPFNIKSQDTKYFHYYPECNVWKIENSTVFNINNFISDAFKWQYVQTPVPYQILDLFFIDSLHGWAGHTGNGALRTTNSGFNWDIISFNDTSFTTSYNGVHFINQNTGWAVGGAVQIRKTTNGGVNWFKQYGPPVAGILRSIYFFDENTGIGAGSKNFPFIPLVIKSTNSGTNWVELNAFFSGAQELNDQHWFNQNTGWICGYDVLLKTTNGGLNFVNLYSNIPPSGNGHIAILAIQFVNQQTGWLGAANLERNNIYKTTNGGNNWFFQPNPVSQNGWNQINDVRFISADSGWAAHGTPGTGAIMFTSNGGTNWLMDNVNYSWYDCLHIFQRSKVWCGGSSGRVWYSLLTEPTGIKQISNSIPEKFSLSQNYPNPFNPKTHFGFLIADFGLVIIKIYDELGKEISTIVNEELKPGLYEAEWEGTNYPSGVYFYKMVTQTYTETRKMVLIR
ncbi:MAG: YCF48-related protein [Ignavibacteria bacterium]